MVSYHDVVRCDVVSSMGDCHTSMLILYKHRQLHNIYTYMHGIVQLQCQHVYAMQQVRNICSICLQFTRPIFDSPKSVSFTCPSDVMSRLQMDRGMKTEE